MSDHLLPIRVQPRAAHEKIMGLHEGRLKVALHAPPVDNAANQALCALLAKAFRVPKSNVSVIKGEKSREKLVRITGATDAVIQSFKHQWGFQEKK
ncbi:MAG: YggU family protein [Magnetococcales bacterium]|nr:YggU family protein [Magnetococcales bacterium]MBF0322326.1 YggU family protein [Magnetococcales bacterium]